MFSADYHSHTHLSPDGDRAATYAAMGAAAAEAGLSELCITEHCECNGFFASAEKNLGFTYDREACRAELASAREALAGRITLPFGVEIGQATQVPDRAAEVLAEEDFDFIIGSLHNIRGWTDFGFAAYESAAQCMSMLSVYLDELLELCTTTRFDVLGHVDYPLRYMHRRFPGVGFHPLEEALRGVLHEAAQRGRGIELNTKALRGADPVDTEQGYLLRLWREEGGELLTVGSDAHTPADVGAGIADRYDLARAAGFDRIATFRAHRPELHRI